jgi:hypothetical protein
VQEGAVVGVGEALRLTAGGRGVVVGVCDSDASVCDSERCCRRRRRHKYFIFQGGRFIYDKGLGTLQLRMGLKRIQERISILTCQCTGRPAGGTGRRPGARVPCQ